MLNLSSDRTRLIKLTLITAPPGQPRSQLETRLCVAVHIAQRNCPTGIWAKTSENACDAVRGCTFFRSVARNETHFPV